MISYNGAPITYDGIGNPLTYYNGTDYTFTWEGRRLKTAIKGNQNFTFTYNVDGIRTSKTVNGVEHTYILDGAQIAAEIWGNNIIVYLYDVNGSPIGMQYRDTMREDYPWECYWFEKNLQGDITYVYDNNGAKKIEYTYDAWGNHTTIYWNGGGNCGAKYNPFRYRGYYYDTDLGLYYLNARYYDSTTGRFINVDGYVSTGTGLTGYNMYAYCGNNPVNRTDPTGEAWWHWALGAAVVALAAVATVVTCGGFAAAATAVSLVSSGVAAATTASTVAAGAFIGSSVAYGSAVLLAASTSNSIEEFNDQGNWGTVTTTTLGGIIGGIGGYVMAKSQSSQTPNKPNNPGRAFQPGGPSIQEGVNPNTLTPAKDLSTLSHQRMLDAVKFAGDRAIEVTRTGVILDGHHRVAYAIQHGQMVDVVVQIFK